MSIMTGKTGGAWLITAWVAENMAGMIRKTFIAENTAAAMATVAECIGVSSFRASILHFVMIDQKSPES